MRIQVNAATTVYTKVKSPQMKMQLNPVTNMMVPTHEDEEENELRQFAVEFRQYPVRRNKAKAALKDLADAIFKDMEEKGLLGE